MLQKLNHFSCFVARELKYLLYKTNKMKTISTISVLLIAISINVTAQKNVNERGNSPKPIAYVPRNQPQNNPAPQQNNNQSNEHWGNGWNNGYPQGYVSLSFGYNSPGYCNAYQYNNYCNNGYSSKKASRYSIRAAGQIINQALAFDSWNDIYSPLLAKAIRHYNYARELYWWGNYQAAYNHAERARYLAWYSLQYFQNPGCGNGYGGGFNEPNPYSDPYNPYYRSNQTGGTMNQGGGNQGSKIADVPTSDGIDQKLPGSDTNDKELLRSFDKSELKGE